jgi:hypothetical protein
LDLFADQSLSLFTEASPTPHHNYSLKESHWNHIQLIMGFDAGGGPQYGNIVGGIFVFNLIVGVGALSLPNGFAYAGMVCVSSSIISFYENLSKRNSTMAQNANFCFLADPVRIPVPSPNFYRFLPSSLSCFWDF